MKPKSPIKGGATSSPRRPGRPPAKEVVTPKVNHPRFQGQSDHEVRIRRQEKSPVTGSPGVGEYKCDSCSFQTTRLNLMVFHKKRRSKHKTEKLLPFVRTYKNREQIHLQNYDGIPLIRYYKNTLFLNFFSKKMKKGCFGAF